MAAKHILVVDDAETIRDLLQSFLLENGYSVECAESCEEASKKIKVRKPDLILLDVVLPDMLGTDYCVNIKSNRETKFIPIIMCSANAISPQDKMKGLDTGADDYVTKPFVLEELSSRIRALLRRVELDKTKHVIDEQAAQTTAAATETQVKVEIPRFPLLKTIGYSFIDPKSVFQNILDALKGWDISLITVFLLVSSLLPAIPSVIHGETKGFMGIFFLTMLSLGMILFGSAFLVFFASKFLLKKDLSLPVLSAVFTIALMPFLLSKLLACIFVFSAGYQAEAAHFSAGLGLFLPAVQAKGLKIASHIVDLFSIWSMVVGAIGISRISDLSFKKAAGIVIVSLSLTIGAMAVFV